MNYAIGQVVKVMVAGQLATCRIEEVTPDPEGNYYRVTVLSGGPLPTLDQNCVWLNDFEIDRGQRLKN